MVLHRKEAVGGGDEHPPGHPRQLGYEEALVLAAADVLDHRVGHGDVEGAVRERQGRVGDHPTVGHLRERAAEVGALSQAQGGDPLRVGVLALQHVGGVVDHVGDPDVEDGLLGLGADQAQEVVVNAIAGRHRQPLGHGLGPDHLIVALVVAARRAHGALLGWRKAMKRAPT